MANYVRSIIDIYPKENLIDENVLFTGINCGPMIAKIFDTLLQHKSISFLSFPMKMNFLENLFHFYTKDISYVTNILNIGGFFSHHDSDYATYIGINTHIFYKSDFCDVFSRADNIYRSFCTMPEICRKGNQFNYYCLYTIGERNLEIIRKSVI